MCVALVGAAVALLMGTALGASITGRSPSVLSDGGGVTLHIRGRKVPTMTRAARRVVVVVIGGAAPPPTDLPRSGGLCSAQYAH
ncbi:hypothetical protein O3P69_009481 [Scylla paramamosain]|uniref:Secreted protein n=1 Tax=Scylla paramamosain TaxID=85552 RepID=A0AAW0SXQ1_SCYPA